MQPQRAHTRYTTTGELDKLLDSLALKVYDARFPGTLSILIRTFSPYHRNYYQPKVCYF